MSKKKQDVFRAYKCELCGRITSDFSLLFNHEDWFECSLHGIICEDHVLTTDYWTLPNTSKCKSCNQTVEIVNGKYNHGIIVNFEQEVIKQFKTIKFLNEINFEISRAFFEEKRKMFLLKLKYIQKTKFTNIIKSFKGIKDFDFSKYVSDLKSDSNKCETIYWYEKYVGSISSKYSEEIWYIDYVSKFKCNEIILNIQNSNNFFNWDFLLQLIASSFSSSYTLVLNDNNTVDCVISVTTADKNISKRLYELLPSQIENLFHIYIEANMRLQILLEKSKQEFNWTEYDSIENERRKYLQKWESEKNSIIRSKQ